MRLDCSGPVARIATRRKRCKVANTARPAPFRLRVHQSGIFEEGNDGNSSIDSADSAFFDLQGPIDPPAPYVAPPPKPRSESSSDEGLGAAVIAGIAVGALIVLCGLMALLYSCFRPGKDKDVSDHSEETGDWAGQSQHDEEDGYGMAVSDLDPKFNRDDDEDDERTR